MKLGVNWPLGAVWSLRKTHWHEHSLPRLELVMSPRVTDLGLWEWRRGSTKEQKQEAFTGDRPARCQG